MKKIAVIYDFDGTLTPESSLEYTLFPYFDIKAAKFWKMCDREVLQNEADYMLTYMRVALEISRERKKPLNRKVFRELALKIKYFKGVETYFTRINRFFSKKFSNVKLNHYIISGNLKEIIASAKIAKNFRGIFGCEYYYEKGVPVFPKVLVNETLKTQFIFRINRGREKIYQPINACVDEKKQPVPFHNMIFIGDGLTDVPSMALVRDNGGYSVAVYRPGDKKGRAQCLRLVKEGRADFSVKADYSGGSELDLIIKSLISGIAVNP